MNTNFKVIGLTRLGIKAESTAPEADANTVRPYELLVSNLFYQRRIFDQTYSTIKENVVKNGGPMIDVCKKIKLNFAIRCVLSS